MADVRVVDPTKDTAALRRRTSTSAGWGTWKQAGKEAHLLAGYTNDRLAQHISLIHFDFGPQLVGVKKVLKAELHVFQTTDHDGFDTQTTPATTKGMKLATLREAFAEDTLTEGDWNGSINQDALNSPSATYVAYGHIHNVNLYENVIDVMPLVRAVLPDSVLDSANKPGLGLTNHGWWMSVSGDSTQAREREWVVASKDHPNTAIRPFVTLTVELKGGPGITRLTSPDGDVAAGSDVFLRGEYEPDVPGDIIKYVQVVISDPANAGATVWTTTKAPDNTGIETSTFAVKVDPAKLKSGTPYEWTARVQNQDGEWTPYVAPKAAIRYLSTVPTLSTPSAPTGTLVNLLAKPFTAIWTSSTQRASVVQVQLRSYLAPTDPTWEEDLIWDSGRVTVPLSTPLVDTTPPPYIQKLSVSYGGPLLPPGVYGYRMQAKDRFNAETDWQYGQVTLTAPFVVQPGGEADLTQYVRDRSPFRIRIFAMGANRGPGKLVAELTDASNVGASEYYNAGGEFYFTIPAIHPQVSVIEPYQTHYSLDFHTPEGWRPKAYGLITDFDASEDEVVFYGMDYPAVLARMVDERFDPTNADLPTDKGGAKYVDKTIDYIIKDQLNKARTAANSPVGFITVGDVPAMAEKVTIYASFKQRLPFIAGLIDSYRGGTGRKTRIVCEQDAAGAFKWRVLNDPGINRDNLRMEYGGLIQGFRTVPFSGWGTAVAAMGRTVLGTKVYADRKVAPGINEATYGSWPTTTMYQDIDDINDLRRRTAQAAAQVAKVGKLMGIGIRVGSLGVKDMWDICDSVPILIQRGVVDTTRFGSGYWTIWGWNWQSYPDGHSDLNLTLAPRQDTVAPNPDLIPSKPILDTPDFATGTGPPDETAYPPVFSMSPFMYLDVASGDVYEKDPDTGAWEVTGSLAGPEGAPGPPGPPGAPGGTGALLGEFNYSRTRGGVPSNMQVRLTNDPVVGVVNSLRVDENAIGGADRSPYFAIPKAGDIIAVDDQNGHIIRVPLSGDPIDQGDWWEFPFIAEGAYTAEEPPNGSNVTLAYDAIGGAGTVPDTTPNDPPVWLAAPLDLVAGTRLAEDGTVLSYIRAFWEPLAAGPPNDDFDHFEVLIRPTVTDYPRNWEVAEGAAASGTFPAGTYTVMVTATGEDGGETVGVTSVLDLSEANRSIVVSGLAASLALGMEFPVNIYVSHTPGGTELRLAATVATDTATITAPPSSGGTPPPTESSALWTALDLVGQSLTNDYTHFVNDALRVFYFALRSVDKAGNKAPDLASLDWRHIASARDEVAPDTPSGVRASDGNKLVGVAWDPVYVADLSRYEVRWMYAPDVVTYDGEGKEIDRVPGVYPEPPHTPAPEWEYGYALSTMFIIRVPEYGEVKGNVRAIDRSGNAGAGLETDPDMGWSDEFRANSLKWAPTDLALDTLWAELADIMELNADDIKAGDIVLAPDPDSAGSIIIKDSAGTIIGYWSPVGWYVIDGTDPSRAVRAHNGVISFTSVGVEGQMAWAWPESVWTVGLSPDGMSADIITSGSLPGGHNRVENSAFELAPLSGPKTVIAYDTAVEWDTAGNMVGAATNKGTGNAGLIQSNYAAP